MGAQLASQTDTEADCGDDFQNKIKSDTSRSQQGRALNRTSIRRNTARDVVTNHSVGLFNAEAIGLFSPRQRRASNRRSQESSGYHLDPEVSSAHRIVVIGDLHGMLHKAKSLWYSLQRSLGESALLSALVIFLGDYVDRGPYTKDLLSWLRTIQRQRASKGARTVFLCGNHEFCLLGFLGLLPKPVGNPEFVFSETWTLFSKSNGRSLDKNRLWGAEEAEDVLDSIHIQGRRWAGSWYEKSYGSHATFSSYGVAMGDRRGLQRAMSQDHLDFLTECPWVHVEENPLLGRLVFVHAGLEAGSVESCEAQLIQLKQRDARQSQPEALFGRDAVLSVPPLLAQTGTTVVSGHHGRVLLKPHRIILDSCCGDEHNPLSALILPEMLLVHDDGTTEPKNYSSVFGSHWQTARAEMISTAASRRSSKSSSVSSTSEKTTPKPPRQSVNGIGAAETTAQARRHSREMDSKSSKGRNMPLSPKCSPRGSRTSERRSNPSSPRTSEIVWKSRRQGTVERAEFTLPPTLAGLSRRTSKERQRPPGDSSPLD